MSIDKYIESDFRNLAFHKLVAEKLCAHPELFEKAKANNKRFSKLVSKSSLSYNSMWEDLLNKGLEPTLKMALDTTELAATLRSCTPFTGILSEDERLEFLIKWKLQREQTAA